MTELQALVGELIDLAVKDPAKARELVSKNPELKDARWIHNETALHFAVVEGFLDAVRLFIDLGFDVNTTNEFGDCPLIDAVTLREYEIAELLLKAGARTDMESSTRGTPLECARDNDDSRMESLLVTYGASVMG